jgi:hypothetical protein
MSLSGIEGSRNIVVGGMGFQNQQDIPNSNITLGLTTTQDYGVISMYDKSSGAPLPDQPILNFSPNIFARSFNGEILDYTYVTDGGIAVYQNTPNPNTYQGYLSAGQVQIQEFDDQGRVINVANTYSNIISVQNFDYSGAGPNPVQSIISMDNTQTETPQILLKKYNVNNVLEYEALVNTDGYNINNYGKGTSSHVSDDYFGVGDNAGNSSYISSSEINNTYATDGNRSRITSQSISVGHFDNTEHYHAITELNLNNGISVHDTSYNITPSSYKPSQVNVAGGTVGYVNINVNGTNYAFPYYALL